MVVVVVAVAVAVAVAVVVVVNGDGENDGADDDDHPRDDHDDGDEGDEDNRHQPFFHHGHVAVDRDLFSCSYSPDLLLARLTTEKFFLASETFQMSRSHQHLEFRPVSRLPFLSSWYTQCLDGSFCMSRVPVLPLLSAAGGARKKPALAGSRARR